MISFYFVLLLLSALMYALSLTHPNPSLPLSPHTLRITQENQNQNHQHDGNAYMQSPHAYAPPSMEEVSRGIAMRNQAFQRASTRPPLSPPVQQTNQVSQSLTLNFSILVVFCYGSGALDSSDALQS